VPGYIPDKDFLPVLRYVAEGQMERGVDFETFRKQLDGH
jgi:thioredoxin-related protein